MTREEIIDGLEIYTVGRLKKAKVHITVEELQEFIDAIKILEQKPCTDTISREAALKCFTLNNTKADAWNNIKASLLLKRWECGKECLVYPNIMMIDTSVHVAVMLFTFQAKETYTHLVVGVVGVVQIMTRSK